MRRIQILFFLLGLTSTITLLRVSTPIKVVTAHNFILYITVVISVVNQKGKIKPKKSALIPLFYIYSFIVFVSTVFSLFFPIGREWVNTSLIKMINYTVFYSTLFVLIHVYDIYKIKEYYFGGLKISTLLQLVWEMLQIFYWYGFHRRLNYELFGKIDLLNDISISQYDFYGNYRFTGLGWQSSNLAMSLLIGYLLSDKRYIKFGYAIGLIASTSRVGIVSLITLIVYKSFNSKINLNTKIKKRDILFFSLVVLTLFYICIYYWNIISEIIKSLSVVSRRFSDISWDLHLLYYLWIPEIMVNIPFIKMLFGYGIGSSGYVYSHFKNVYIDIGPWVPENDFCSSLFGVGIIGMAVQYTWYIKGMNSRDKRSKDFCILFVILISGFMYAYFDSWVLIIIMFCMCGDYVK